MGNAEGSKTNNFIVCTIHLINIVRVIKSRRLKWTGHIARIEDGKRTFKHLTGKRLLRRPRRR